MRRTTNQINRTKKEGYSLNRIKTATQSGLHGDVNSSPAVSVKQPGNIKAQTQTWPIRQFLFVIVPLERLWPSALRRCGLIPSWSCGKSRTHTVFLHCSETTEELGMGMMEWMKMECWVLDGLGQITGLDVLSEDCSSFQFKCCGFTNYTDFLGSKFEKENDGNLPPSCCWTNGSPCRRGEAQRSNVQVRKHDSNSVS